MAVLECCIPQSGTNLYGSRGHFAEVMSVTKCYSYGHKFTFKINIYRMDVILVFQDSKYESTMTTVLLGWRGMTYNLSIYLSRF